MQFNKLTTTLCALAAASNAVSITQIDADYEMDLYDFAEVLAEYSLYTAGDQTNGNATFLDLT